MSQAVNTFWINQSKSSTRENPGAKRRLRVRRFVDALVMMIILAAAALCASVYTRTSSEISAATLKHRAALERVESLRLETERLQMEVQRLKTDQKFIESVARHSMGLVRSGDVIINLSQDQEVETGGER